VNSTKGSTTVISYRVLVVRMVNMDSSNIWRRKPFTSGIKLKKNQVFISVKE